MELSDREKRLLDEMEAALLTEDPRLVSALSAGPSSPNRQRIMIGAGLVLLGLATLFGGLVSKVTPIGILGFLIALSGVISVISSFTPRSGQKASKKPRARSSISDRMEKRWDNRSNEE
jgi:uncharacterized membrane protein HdeD (DUF308 family)